MVPLIFILFPTEKSNLENALERIMQDDVVKSIENIMRVE